MVSNNKRLKEIMNKRFYHEILRGDMRKVVPLMPKESVDLFLFSPPYNTHDKDMYDVYDDDKEYEEYINFLSECFGILIERLKKGGHICVVMAPGIGRVPYEPYHASLVEKIRVTYSSIYLVGYKMWLKSHTGKRPTAIGSIFNKPSFTDDFEFITVWRKGREDRDGKPGEIVNKQFFEDMATTWTEKPATSKGERLGHNAVFPVGLTKRIIKWFIRKDELVVDPFCGVGTTVVAAKKLMRNAIGIELSKNYCRTARRRVNRTINMKYLEE